MTETVAWMYWKYIPRKAQPIQKVEMCVMKFSKKYVDVVPQIY